MLGNEIDILSYSVNRFVKNRDLPPIVNRTENVNNHYLQKFEPADQFHHPITIKQDKKTHNSKGHGKGMHRSPVPLLKAPEQRKMPVYKGFSVLNLASLTSK